LPRYWFNSINSLPSRLILNANRISNMYGMCCRYFQCRNSQNNSLCRLWIWYIQSSQCYVVYILYSWNLPKCDWLIILHKLCCWKLLKRHWTDCVSHMLSWNFWCCNRINCVQLLFSWNIKRCYRSNCIDNVCKLHSWPL
jgi:hypothetical protein